MNKQKLRFLLSLLIIVIAGCAQEAKHSKMSDSDAAPPPTQEIDLETLAKNPKLIAFSNIQTIFSNNACNRCHADGASQGDVSLAQYSHLSGQDGYKPVLKPGSDEGSRLYRALNAKGALRMPPASVGPRLSALEQSVIRGWILNGAPLEAKKDQCGTETDEVEPPKPPVHISEELDPYFTNPESIDFEVVNKYVFSTSCNDCHSSNGSKPDLEAGFAFDTTSYSLTVNELGIGSAAFVKGKPYETDAFISVAMRQNMPKTRDGYRLLDPYRVKLLKLWILNCAIETFEPDSEENLKTRGQKRRTCEGEETAL